MKQEMALISAVRMKLACIAMHYRRTIITPFYLIHIKCISGLLMHKYMQKICMRFHENYA